MSDIFISYASEDRQRAQQLAKALEEEGWSTFWDRTIPIGKTWREVIGEELMAARCVIVLWSENSVGSKWVQEEADDGGRRSVLIPILIDDVSPPIGFRSIQAADLSDWDGTEATVAYKRLIADVAALIGPPRTGSEAKRKPIVPEGIVWPKEATQPRTAETNHEAEADYAPVDSIGGGHKVQLASLFALVVLLAIASTWYVQERRLEATRELQQTKEAEARSQMLAEAEEERRRAAAQAQHKAEAERRQAAAEAERRLEEERRHAAAEAQHKAEAESRQAAAEAERRLEEERRRAAAEAQRKATDHARRAEEKAREAEIRLGLTRAERRDVQRMLRLQGYEVGNFDGLFGTRTRSAIRMWQQDADEEPTGYFVNRDQYIRFRRAAAAKVRELPSLDAFPVRVFRVPRADISIDGRKEDWRAVEPVFVDLAGEPKAHLPGTDLGAFYMAVDGPYLCLAMTLNNGPPDPHRDTMYFFVAQREPFAVDAPGDMDAATAYSAGRWHVWTGMRGRGGAPLREATDYPAHFAAYGSNFVEWKVPLSDVQPLSGRFVRAYIHVEGENVSDKGLPAIKLIVE